MSLMHIRNEKTAFGFRYRLIFPFFFSATIFITFFFLAMRGQEILDKNINR